MPDPKIDSYSRYREGVIKRHITREGKLLAFVWLKQFEEGIDDPWKNNKRIFSAPRVHEFQEGNPVFEGGLNDEIYPPNFVEANGQLFCVWKFNNDVRISMTDNNDDWSPSVVIDIPGLNPIQSPSISFFDDSYILAWVDENYHVNLASSQNLEIWNVPLIFDGINLPDILSKDSPSLFVHEGILNMLYSDFDSYKMKLIESQDAINWNNAQVISDTETTYNSPSITYFENKYYIAWCQKSGYISIMSSDDKINWENKKMFSFNPKRAISFSKPSLIAHDSGIYLGWIPHTNIEALPTSLSLLFSKDGMIWQPKEKSATNFYSKRGNFPNLFTKEGGDSLLVGWMNYTNYNHNTETLTQPYINLSKISVLQPTEEQENVEYVPWIMRKDDVITGVHGGGDNPLLQGGICSAIFACEFLVDQNPESLNYAKRLFDFFLLSEVKRNGEPTGYFTRCRHKSYEEIEPNQAASADEIIGLVLGLFYLYKSSLKTESNFNREIVSMANRLGKNLKENAYVIIPPENTELPQELHRGSLGLNMYEYAVSEAIFRITGNRYNALKSDYFTASLKIWKMVGGRSARSSSSPTLFSHSNRLFLLWKGTNKKDFIRIMESNNGSAWGNKRKMNDKDTTSHKPAMAFFKDKYYIAWTGTNRKQYLNIISSDDSTTWGNKITFDDSGDMEEARSRSWPTLKVSEDDYTMFLVWCDHKKRAKIWIMETTDGRNWTNKQSINNVDNTSHGVGFSFFIDRYYIAWTGTNNDENINIISSVPREQGESWNWGNKFTFNNDPETARSQSGPDLFAIGEKLYLSWCGTNNRDKIRIIDTQDGEHWVNKRVVKDETDSDRIQVENTNHSPSFCRFGNKFLIAWTGTNKYNNINILDSSDSDKWENKVTFYDIFQPTSASGRYEDLLSIFGLMFIWNDRGLVSLDISNDWKYAVKRFRKDVVDKNINTYISNTYISDLKLKEKAFLIGVSLLFVFFPYSMLALSSVAIGGIITIIKKNLKNFKDPYERYLLTNRLLKLVIEYNSTESWFNHALSLHCFHSSLHLEAKSKSSPNLCKVNEKVFMTWSGRKSRKIYLADSLDGHDWSVKRSINGNDTTLHKPTMAFFQDKYFIAWTGVNRHKNINIISSDDEINWNNKITFNGNDPASPEAKSRSWPTLKVSENGDTMFLVWCGYKEKAKIWIMETTDGRNWTNKQSINNVDKTSHGVGFSFFIDRYYIAWTGTNDDENINIISSEPREQGEPWNWGNKFTFNNNPESARSQSGPDLYVTDETLYLSWCGTNDRDKIRIIDTQDGELWVNKREVKDETDSRHIQVENTNHSPSLCYFNNKFLIAWTGTDKANYVNVLNSTDSEIWKNKVTFRSKEVADHAAEYIKSMISGERIGKNQYPDRNFYAAMVAKGLVSQYAEVDFMNIVNYAINAREGMYLENPVSGYHDDELDAPIKYHHSRNNTIETANFGNHFCWENKPGGRSFYKSRFNDTGVNEGLLNQLFDNSIDAFVEASGLGFMFPRILMSYWLKEEINIDYEQYEVLDTETC